MRPSAVVAAVSDSAVHGMVLVIVAAVFAVVVTFAFRRGMISFRYWFGWLAIATVLAVVGIVLATLPKGWEVFGLRPVELGVSAYLLVSLLVSVQLSVSISGHQRYLTTLAQEVAALRRRLDVLEDGSAGAGAGEPTGAPDHHRAGQ